MSEFSRFSKIVHERFALMSKGELFVTNVNQEQIWATYLASFPAGTNEIFRERTEHDCSCCRNFIKNLGGVVAVVEGKLMSVWSGEGMEYPYNVVSSELAALVENQLIVGLFRTKEPKYGLPSNFEMIDGVSKKWNHLHGDVARQHHSNSASQVCGDYATSAAVFERGLHELTPAALDLVIDLINENALYRGAEFLPTVTAFRNVQKAYLKQLTPAAHNILVWVNAGSAVARFRNTAIGTLVQDISEGMDTERAVRSFESKVAPTNYKRTTALITPAMVALAMTTIKSLDLEPALERRFATIHDISVNNVLWVDNSVKGHMKGSIESLLMGAATTAAKTSKAKQVPMGIEQFMTDVLPLAESISLFVKGSMQGNFMSLTAPVHADVQPLFKWANNFGWSYDGNITDSDMRRAVQARGGRVDGVFRFTHSWNHNTPNTSLMDLHVFMPGSNVGVANPTDDKYGTGRRIGWNHRNDGHSGGSQDVDYVGAAPSGYIPVENITFPDLARMPEGTYICKVHNWQWRHGTAGGFKAEVEFAGQVFEYEYPKMLKNKEWVTVAEVTLNAGQFSIKHHLPTTTSSQEKWGLNTEQFIKVNTLMLSPNHWDDQHIGNKHWFFVLDQCLNDAPTRGIYNEFLSNALDKHSKVFEVLGEKTKCQPTTEQLSGLGFSSTRGDTVLVEVGNGKQSKTYSLSF